VVAGTIIGGRWRSVDEVEVATAAGCERLSRQILDALKATGYVRQAGGVG